MTVNGVAAIDASEKRRPSLTPVQKALVIILVAVPFGRVFVPSSPKLFSSVDPGFLWACIGAGFLTSQIVFWGLFGAGHRRPGHATAKIALGALSMFLGALYAMLFGLFATSLFGFYQLRYLAHDRREKLYVIELVTEAGRGGPHAYVDPYGFGRWGLPLSRADFDAFIGGRYTSKGVVCYRVAELRRGDVVGIEEPSTHSPSSGVLVKCHVGEPGVVTHDTDYRSEKIR